MQADAIFSENEGIEDWSFDLIWESAARIGPEGWVAEVAIPFSQLRFPRTSAPQTWGFDVGRSWPRKSPLPRSSRRHGASGPWTMPS